MSQWHETLRGMAFPHYCDHMGHVNNRWYAHFFDDASMSLWSQIGLSERALRERYATSAVIAHVEIDFSNELVADDQFVIKSAFSRIGTKSLTLTSLLHHCDSQALCARQTMVAVFFDVQTRQSAPMPDSIRKIVTPFLVGDDIESS